MSGLFVGEAEAIEQVIEAGRMYGYGNMIAYLKREWAEELMRSGLAENVAVHAADTSGYPVRKDNI